MTNPTRSGIRLSTTCQLCNATTDNATICNRHTDALTADLRALPGWLRELETTLTRQGNTTSGGGGKPTKKAEQPLPFHAPAADLLNDARAGLASTVAHLCTSRGIRPPAGLSAMQSASFLLGAVESIRIDELAGQIATNMRDLSSAIRSMVDSTGRRWLGRCDALVQDREVTVTVADGEASLVVGEPVGPARRCSADLRARANTASVKCRECSAVHDVADLFRRIIADNREYLGTAAFLAEALNRAGHRLRGGAIKADTLRKWERREKLFGWREDDEGASMFRVGDVLDLIAESNERAAGERMAS